jgi:hypothetical protein
MSENSIYRLPLLDIARDKALLSQLKDAAPSKTLFEACSDPLIWCVCDLKNSTMRLQV